MDVRIRLPELMRDAHVPTAYALSILSGERISMSTAHRLVKAQGVVRYLDADLLDVLCEVFNVGPEKLLTQAEPPTPEATPAGTSRGRVAAKPATGKASARAATRKPRARRSSSFSPATRSS